ncbi:MAG: dipicolinate synthase subunit DpsA [Lachnospiraceae bacterium]|nr:dipicolinate synthase subunit DpsA [Lachnospiraceae bacterium]
MKNFLVLGGDLRQFYLTEKLKASGENTEVYFDRESNFSLEEVMEKSDIIICPIPFTKDKKNIFSTQGIEELDIEKFLNCVTSRHTIWGGNIPQKIKNELKERNISFFDFMESEEVSIKNAVATAEGTIAEAIRLSTKNLHNSKCLVLGYGRCGKVLSQKLKALDAHVTVGGRSDEKLANAFAFGLETVNLKNLESAINKFDFIFNTVPELIVGKNLIDLMKKDVVIIDISSAPGGVDFDYCRVLGINASLCLGLPGKFSPETSANILFDAIIKGL